MPEITKKERTLAKAQFTNSRRALLVEINKDEADKKNILGALDDLSALATSTIACCVEGDASDWYEEVQLLEQQYAEAVSRAGDVLEQLRTERPSKATSISHSPATRERAAKIREVRSLLKEKLCDEEDEEEEEVPSVDVSESAGVYQSKVKSNAPVKRTCISDKPTTSTQGRVTSLLSAVTMETASPEPKASELSQARMKQEPLAARTVAPSSTGSQRVPMATGLVTMATANTGTAAIQSTPSTSATTRDFTRHIGAPLALSQQYTAPNPAYTAPNPAYTAPNPAYTAPNPAYTAPNPTYTAPNPTYTALNPAYTAPNPAYTAPNPAYTAPNLAYTAPNPAYTAPNPGYTAPNPAPQQQSQYAPQQQSQAAYTYTPQQQQSQPSYTYTSQQYLPQQQQLPSTYMPQYQPQNVQQPQYLRTSQPQTDITTWHMKKVSIATFAGDKREYEVWKAAFDVSIDQQATSTEMKMLQLRQYLSGEALAVVQTLGFTPSAYSAARRRLEKRYGGQRRMVAVHMQELEDFPAVKIRAADFEKFADLLEVAVVKMTDAGMTSELGTGTLYTRMQKKLATENLVQYHRWVQETNANESVTTLLDWVNREAEIMATASETIDGIASTASSRQRRGGFNDRKPRNAESSGRVFLAEKKSESCAACSEQHPVWKCPSFKAKTVDER
ncbi:tyrosine-protein phosphatase non-receptor type 23-like [Sycon ciliatum]|uniref:tyrosine-protein phosphatase non-receptor type 23-like n=1 Tax=Sycon ciliatum TaxID=27933 RepID=UPI0031F65408